MEMETQTQNQNNNTDIFTFMYCMIHDDGFIIQGNHDYVPYGYVIQHSQNCDSCDWYNMGVIKINDVNNDEITVIKTVRLNYDRYGGGFTFKNYLNTLTDDKGKYIDINNDSEDDCILYQWIQYINDNLEYEFLEP